MFSKKTRARERLRRDTRCQQVSDLRIKYQYASASQRLADAIHRIKDARQHTFLAKHFMQAEKRKKKGFWNAINIFDPGEYELLTGEIVTFRDLIEKMIEKRNKNGV